MRFRTFFKSRCLVFLLFFFFLLFASPQARAAITIDNTSSNGAFNVSGITSLSWMHSTGTGTNRALFVGVSTATTTLPVGVPTNRVASVTYNGIALTRVGTAISPNSLNTSEIFRLTNPSSGTNTILVTFATVPVAGNPFVNYAVGGAISLQGVSQTTPNGGFFSASGTNSAPTVTVTDSVAGDLVLDTLAASPTAVFVAPNAAQTEQWDGQTFFGNAFDIGAGSTKPATGVTTTMNWITSNADNWALGATAVKQFVTTAAAVTIGGRVTTQSGRGLANARVRLTGADGAPRYAVTSPFGYYLFENVQAGENYTISVEAKQYTFAPQIVAVGEELRELNFVAEQ